MKLANGGGFCVGGKVGEFDVCKTMLGTETFVVRGGAEIICEATRPSFVCNFGANELVRPWPDAWHSAKQSQADPMTRKQSANHLKTWDQEGAALPGVPFGVRRSRAASRRGLRFGPSEKSARRLARSRKGGFKERRLRPSAAPAFPVGSVRLFVYKCIR